MARELDEKIKELAEKLDQGVRALVNGDAYKEYLDTMAKFYHYSVNNSLLIGMQKKDATYVASYGDWQKKFDRQVKRGEKGIKIFAPAPYKVHRLKDKIDPNTGQVVIGADGKPVQENVEVVVQAFKVTSVFDISQTEGKELPSIVRELQGTKEDYERMFTAIQCISPVPISFERINTGANGYYSLADREIVIKDGMSELQTLKTSIHELAHAKLHDRETGLMKDNMPDGNTREVQAESIAYVVCQHYGIDTSDYSFGYIAGWSAGKEIPEFKESMAVIRSTAAEIITGIDREMERMQEQEKAYTLAIEIDEFARNFDLYEYEDVLVCKEAMIDSIMKDLQKGNTGYLNKWFNLAYANAATEGEAFKALELKARIMEFTKPELPVAMKEPTRIPGHHI